METRHGAPLRAPEAKPAALALPPYLRRAIAARGPAPERKDDAGGRGWLDTAAEVKFADAAAEEAGVIEGYASKFGEVDRGFDQVEKGAFKASLAALKKRKAPLPILWQHDSKTPIGIWTELAEDDVGLYVKGQLLLEIPQALICRVLVKAKAVTGLSIGYETVEREYDKAGIRHLKKVDLWEISPVTFPMQISAQITGIKGDIDPKALERALRDEAGLSISEAKAAISVFCQHALRDAGTHDTAPRDGADQVLTSLRKSIAALR